MIHVVHAETGGRGREGKGREGRGGGEEKSKFFCSKQPLVFYSILLQRTVVSGSQALRLSGSQALRLSGSQALRLR